MNKIAIITFSLFIHCICTVNAQIMNDSVSTEFKPSGKPELQIFSNFHSTFFNSKNATRFELTRAYLGYEYNFSPALSARVTLEVGNPGTGNFQFTALLKNGYLQYQKEKLTVKFGLVGTPLFDVQETLWGYRYIFKSFIDQYGMGPSNDFGLTASYKFSNLLSADAIIQNGEGYTRLDADSTLKFGLGLTLHPIENLTVRGYFDIMQIENASQQTIALIIGYAGKAFRLSAEYNYQTDNNLVKDHDYSGFSFSGTFNAHSRLAIFARYDYLNSKNKISDLVPWNYINDGQQFIAGFEYIPVIGVKISPNFQGWKPRDNSESFHSGFFLNVGVNL